LRSQDLIRNAAQQDDDDPGRKATTAEWTVFMDRLRQAELRHGIDTSTGYGAEGRYTTVGDLQRLTDKLNAAILAAEVDAARAVRAQNVPERTEPPPSAAMGDIPAPAAENAAAGPVDAQAGNLPADVPDAGERLASPEQRSAIGSLCERLGINPAAELPAGLTFADAAARIPALNERLNPATGEQRPLM
jgi:hypothetical protein